MVEGVVIDLAPVVVAHKCRHKQQQRGLRLVEVGDHALDNAVGVSWRYHQLCAAQVVAGMVTVEIGDNVLQ